ARRRPARRRAATGPGLLPWQAAEARAFLVAAPPDTLSVAAAAERCKLSRGYFIKAFRVTFGQTPYRWLLEYRVAAAKALLRGPMPIATIALELGFADQSHFTRVFARIAGTPPGLWRRQQARTMADA
ncbi:MAG: helix-turn-helix transcriptional regulator, partial [Rhodospirillales bacterium]|nr:helix-turn-helix transcriptional regulator [Rhodospirillales bacterium]